MTSWPIVPLSDVFDIARGGSPRPIDSYITESDSGINWIMISDASEGSKYITRTRKRIRREGAQRSRLVKPGDFLLTNSMSFGKPYIMQTSGCIHDGWLVLSPRRNDVHADFFYYLLGSKTLYTEFERRASGATVKNLNIDLVRGVTVPLPPLAEQRRIAEILDKADALRTKRRAALAQLDTLTQSIFLDMFGDPSANPRGWRIQKLSEIAVKITDGEHLNPEFSPSGMPMVMAGDVLEDGIDFSKTKTVEHATGERFRKKCNPERGDLLLVSRGATIGRQCIVRSDAAFCLMGSVILVKLDKDVVDPQFLNSYLQHPAIRSMLYRTSGSSAQQAIYLKDVRSLRVMLPAMTHQLLFAKRMDSVERVKQVGWASVEKFEDLFVILQERAFRGEL